MMDRLILAHYANETKPNETIQSANTDLLRKLRLLQGSCDGLVTFVLQRPVFFVFVICRTAGKMKMFTMFTTLNKVFIKDITSLTNLYFTQC